MTKRRAFFRQLSATMAAFTIGDRVVPSVEALAPDEQWLAGLNGKHKQFFDVNVHNAGAPLGRVANFFDSYVQAYGLRDPDLNALVGTHGTGLGLVLDDASWQRYSLGERYGVTDPTTKAAARRNPFARRTDGASVEGLQRRGARFLACRQSIARLSRELAQAGLGTDSALAAEIERGLLPGVTPVPAMIVAGNRAQEAGCSYVFVG